MRNIYNLLLILFFFPAIGKAQIQLIYFTDAHQLYELDDVEGGRGGIARLKTIVDQSKKEDKSTLTIHGGDFVGGVLYGGIYKGAHMPAAFNEIPVDIFNFGQHEFDYGVDHLLSLIRLSKGQFFTSNLVDAAHQPFNNLPTYLLKKVNGKQVLFIGLTDQMETTKKDERAKQADLFTSVEKVFSNVNLNLVDYIVAVTQMDLAKNKALVNRFPAIDLVLTEELEEYHTQIHYQNNVPIIAPSGNMSAVAKINLQSNKKTQIEIISLDKEVSYDKDLRALELHEKSSVDDLLQEKLADLKVDLDAFASLKEESLAGNLITDAMRDRYQTDFAMIDGSGIRKSISQGNFTFEKVRTLLPFGNKMVVVQLKGKDLIDFITSYLINSKPKLVQISGGSYQWNKTNNLVEMDQVKADEIYTLVLNDYNFGKLKKFEKIIIDANHSDSVEDYIVLKDYIQKLKIIQPKIENRIIIQYGQE